MKIHDGPPLLAQALPSGSRVTKSSVTESPSALTPAAIYHGSEPYSAAPTGSPRNIEVYARVIATEEEQRQYLEVAMLLAWDLGDATGDLKHAYEAALKELSPELAAKDWGFSIANGQLVLSEGSDKLTEAEIDSIHKALSGSGVDLAARTVADTTIKALEYDRNYGDDNVSNGIGRFDVSRENFADIVDLRAYLNTHAPGGKYGQDVKDQSDYRGLYRMTGGHAMMDQIAARAVPRFAR